MTDKKYPSPYICTRCGHIDLIGNQFHSCNIKTPKVSFYSNRYSKCISCKHNIDGICKAETNNLTKNIGNKIQDFYDICPERFWLPAIAFCENCENWNVNTVFGVSVCEHCENLINHQQELMGSDRKTEKVREPGEAVRGNENISVITAPFSKAFMLDPATELQFLSTDDLMRDTLGLISKLPKDIDAIIGVARSGIPPASMLSLMMHLPFYVLRQSMNDIVIAGNGWRLLDSESTKAHKHVLVIDDTVLTGTSNRKARSIIGAQFDKVTYATVYANPNARTLPDIWSKDLKWPHFLEWNIFNSILTPNMAIDFDGILCWDCKPQDDDDGDRYIDFILNAKPKYMIRKSNIPLIVTARLEKYRDQTLEWLDTHGMKVNKLIMHPADTLKERRQDNIGRFKALHYKEFCKNVKSRPAPNIFIESEDRQAQIISKITNKIAICPSTRKCYQ